MRFIDLSGQRFGRLTVAWVAGRGTTGKGSRVKKFPPTQWLCFCDCGKFTVVTGANLYSGNTQSCGCLHNELCAKRLTTHGRSRTPEHTMYLMAKVRAKRKGLEFDIELNDVVIPSICPMLGIPLKAANGTLNDNSPTLDRRDGTKGYVKGNVRVISYKANRAKGTLTLEEMKLMVANW